MTSGTAVTSLTICTAFSKLSVSLAKTLTLPSSSTSTLAPDWATIPLIVSPPLPITSRILSVGIFITLVLGAFFDAALGSEITWFIWPRILSLASFACLSAIDIMSSVIPSIFISIWSALIPFDVPATLKSISPRWSSSPRISVSTVNRSTSLTRPIAIPATGAFIGTPASISESEEPQTLAIELEPLDSVISETIRIV